MLHDVRDADRYNSEAWVISFLLSLYISKSIDVLSKKSVDGYRNRVFTESNKCLFAVMIGDKTIDDLNVYDRNRLDKLVKMRKRTIEIESKMMRRRGR